MKKKKVIRLIAVTMTSAICLTGCTNPITAIKDKFSGKGEEQAELEVAESPIVLTDMTEWVVGDSFNVDQIVVATNPEKVVTDIMFMDSEGNVRTDFTCTTPGTFSIATVVVYEDGSQEENTYVFNVIGEATEPTTEAEEIKEVSLPAGWEQKINSGEYSLKVFTTAHDDKISYLKPNIMVTGGTADELLFNEIDGVNYSLKYMDEYVNAITESIEETASEAESAVAEAPLSEEDWKKAVEEGTLEVPEGGTYQTYLEGFEQVSETVSSVIKTQTSNIDSSKWTGSIDVNWTDYSSLVEGVELMWCNSYAYSKLPSGGYLVLEASPAETPTVTIPTDLIDSAQVNEEAKEQLQDSIDAWNTSAMELKTLQGKATIGINEIYEYAVLEDLSDWVPTTPITTTPTEEQVVQEEAPSEQPQQQEQESEAEPQVSAERQLTYKEKYPSLYTWPDQQSIYGMNPKMLVYDLLSQSDEQGNVKYENCLVPIWGISEHKFLNDMDFDSGSSNRQNSTTNVNPNGNASTTGGGLFGNTTQGNNNDDDADGDGVYEDEDFTKATLSTSFGDFIVTGTTSIEVDEGASSRSQVTLKDSDSKTYKVIATTSATIEKTKTKPMHDIPDINLNTWQCYKGASETTTTGTITRYYVTYETNDGEAHVAEYMYVISTESGYIMVMPDEAITTTSSTMYSICKNIKEK